MKDKYWIRAMALIMAVIMLGSPFLMQMSPEAAKKMNKTSLSLNVGKKYTLKIPGVKKAKWTSSNKSVASVNSRGKVTAKKKGSATISAKAGGKTYKCQVTVMQPSKSIKSVTLNRTSISLTKAGETCALKANVSPKNAKKEKLKWSSSNKSVASVSSKGVVKAVGNGQCTISVKVAGKFASCTVSVTISGNNPGDPKCPHVWDSGEVTKAATCSKEGIKTYTCRRCGATKTKPISKTEHRWIEQGITVYPTCGEEGVMTYKCRYCGKVKDVSLPAYGGHEWDNGVVTFPATCHTDGLMVRTCKVCGQTSEFPIPKGDNTHVWDAGTVTKEPTCAEYGTKVYTCTVCGSTREESIPYSNNHDYGDWSVSIAPTCTRGGVEIRTCKRCSCMDSRSVRPIEHNWVFHEEQGHYGDKDVIIPSAEVCNQCGKVFIYRKNLPYYLENFNVTEDEIITQGYTIADDATIAVGNHVFDDGVVTNGVPCGSWSNLNVPITKHNQWIVDEPSYYQCSVCGEVRYIVP